LVGASILALAAPASAAQVEKIAGGLDNPRHLALGDDELYVAEAGRGGPGPCFPGEGGEGPPACVGDTGAVTVIDDDGDQERLVEGLASFAEQGTGGGAIGPHGIFVVDGDKVLITNGGPTSANRDELAAQNPVANLFGRVLAIKEHGGIVRLADIWDFERDNNPDAQVGDPAVDSNAVDVLVDHRRLVVADAGGNTLLTASKRDGIEVLSLFENRLFPNPFGGPDIPTQTVPTGVVKGPDGDYYMSQLTGFPFPVGGANVYRVDRDTGEAEVYASGFTNLMDLAFDEDGTLWVLEIDHDGLLNPGLDGAIYAVRRDGSKRQLELDPGALVFPGGITVGRDGDLYVTNKSVLAGGGEVLRIEVDDDENKGHRRHKGHHKHKSGRKHKRHHRKGGDD